MILVFAAFISSYILRSASPFAVLYTFPHQNIKKLFSKNKQQRFKKYKVEIRNAIHKLTFKMITVLRDELINF